MIRPIVYATFFPTLLSLIGSVLVLLSYYSSLGIAQPKAALLIRNLAFSDLAWFISSLIQSSIWISGNIVSRNLCLVLCPILNFSRMASLIWTCAISFDVLMSVNRRRWLWKSNEISWNRYRYYYYLAIFISCFPITAILIFIQQSNSHMVGCADQFEDVSDIESLQITLANVIPMALAFVFNVAIYLNVRNKMSLKAYPLSVRKKRRRIMYNYIRVCIWCWLPVMIEYLLYFFVGDSKNGKQFARLFSLFSRATSYLAGFFNFVFFGMQDPYLRSSCQSALLYIKVCFGMEKSEEDEMDTPLLSPSSSLDPSNNMNLPHDSSKKHLTSYVTQSSSTPSSTNSNSIDSRSSVGSGQSVGFEFVQTQAPSTGGGILSEASKSGKTNSGKRRVKVREMEKSVMFEESTITGNADFYMNKKLTGKHLRLSREERERLYVDRPDLLPTPKKQTGGGGHSSGAGGGSGSGGSKKGMIGGLVLASPPPSPTLGSSPPPKHHPLYSQTQLSPSPPSSTQLPMSPPSSSTILSSSPVRPTSLSSNSETLLSHYHPPVPIHPPIPHRIINDEGSPTPTPTPFPSPSPSPSSPPALILAKSDDLSPPVILIDDSSSHSSSPGQISIDIENPMNFEQETDSNMPFQQVKIDGNLRKLVQDIENPEPEPLEISSSSPPIDPPSYSSTIPSFPSPNAISVSPSDSQSIQSSLGAGLRLMMPYKDETDDESSEEVNSSSSDDEADDEDYRIHLSMNLALASREASIARSRRRRK